MLSLSDLYLNPSIKTLKDYFLRIYFPLKIVMNFYYKFNELKVFGIKFKFLQENPVLILNLQNFALISFEFTSFISIRVFVASSLSLEKFDKLSKKRKRKFKKNFGNFIYSYFYFLCIFILPPPIAVSGLL